MKNFGFTKVLNAYTSLYDSETLKDRLPCNEDRVRLELSQKRTLGECDLDPSHFVRKSKTLHGQLFRV